MTLRILAAGHCLILTLIGTATEAQAVGAAPGKARVLTISGGISLGAYEAGYNWAFIRDLKERRASLAPGMPDDTLAGVTGASAGTINTFLTAIAWCQSRAVDGRENAENNAFWNTWTTIGWDRLFPTPGITCQDYSTRYDPALDCSATGPDGSAYLPDDGAFTRRAFEEVERDIAARVAVVGDFLPNCMLPIGMTVTRVVPDTLLVGDATGPDAANRLKISTQRFAVALHAQTDRKGLGFYTGAIPEDPRVVGKYLRLPSDSTGRARVERDADRSRFTLFDVIEASSAFPIAFGPKRFHVCIPDPSAGVDPQCPAGSKAVAYDFVDGGVFDNIPLGLATTFVTTPFQEGQSRQPALALAGLPTGQHQLRFHYIDPATLRYPALQRPAHNQPARDLDYLGRLLGNFVNVGRQYELQTVSRFGWLQGSDFRLSTRFAIIAGEQLGAFGAFTAKPFRQYDYYVGVYDALQDFAREACASDGANRRLCELRQVYAAHERLGLGRTASASYVVRQLLRRELAFGDTGPMAAALLSQDVGAGKSFQQWMDELPDGKVAPWLVKLVAAGAAGAHTVDPDASLLERFTSLVGALGGNAEVLDVELDDSERRVINDTEQWFWLSTAQVMDRLRAIEKEPKPREGAVGAVIFSLGDEAARTKWALRRTGLALQPGTAVAGWSYLPYNLTLFPGRGGFEASWRPSWMPAEHWGFNLPVSPFSWWRQSHIAASAGLNGVWRPGGLFISTLEVGPRVYFDYWRSDTIGSGAGERLGLGADAGLYILGGKLRLGLALRDFQGRTEGNWRPEFTLGLADVPGLARAVKRAIR